MSAYRIPRPATAFSKAPTGKRKRVQNQQHLRFIRQLPCCVTGSRPVEAAHISYSDARYAKPAAGMGEKADDKFTVPLSPAMHRKQHDMNERKFWQGTGIDPIALCAALYAVSGDLEAGELILREFRGKG